MKAVDESALEELRQEVDFLRENGIAGISESLEKTDKEINGLR